MLQILFLLGFLFGQHASNNPFERGMLALQTEKVQEAAHHFRSALAEEPGNSLVWFRLAGILVDLGQLNEAEQAYRKSLEYDSVRPDAKIELGALLRDLGRLEESHGLLKRVLLTNPDFGPAHFQMALLMDQMKKPQQALHLYRSAISNIQSQLATKGP